jgi:hypothetical protein
MDDDAIRRYCDELATNAELARRDRVEIEEHLRELADDLQANGMPRAVALTEACRRLGAPAAIAREYARVRPAFGAQLSRARAWSAAVLLAWWWLDFARLTLTGPGQVPGFGSIYGVNLVISAVALGGLVARASWARAIICGALSWFVVEEAIVIAWQGMPRDHDVWAVACKVGAFAFVAPWRRRELAPAGLAIVLLAWTYHGVNVLAMHEMTAPSQLPFIGVWLSLAFVATLAAGLGVLARARWAAPAALAAALGLALGYTEIKALVYAHGSALYHALAVGGIAAGACASVLAAIVSWRTARSTLGSLGGRMHA